jgi:alpha-beta hydrolase superfamily lysophospholipase
MNAKVSMWAFSVCAVLFLNAAQAQSSAPQTAKCPTGVPTDARCLTGQDSAGAFYWIAVPAAWNQVLVMHAHGGPELGEPRTQRSADDLTRWAITVKAGYAWAGSTFRQGGVEVRAAAEDTERLRQIFVQHVAQPKLTLLHGQSWGASVAAKGAEMYAASANGRSPYDGVLLTSGVLGGGTRSYEFRLDLRVVYQALCNNHPLHSEPPYPLWQGLPPGSKLSRADLAQRVNDCTGLNLKADQRSIDQQRKLTSILNVVRIPERSLLGHLNWGTWHFADVVFKRLNGGNPWGNVGAVYSGSDDDAALNRTVARYRADADAVARFAADTDLTGRITVPVLTAHAVNDPVAFVELESAFLETMQRAGNTKNLAQVFTTQSEHSYWSDPEYPALLEALQGWVEGRSKPSAQGISDACKRFAETYSGACHFDVNYRAPTLGSRVTGRERSNLRSP